SATSPPAGGLGPTRPGDGGTADAQLVAEGTLELRESDYVDLATGTMSSSRDAGSDFFLIGGDGFFLDAAVGETLALAHGAGDRADCAETLPRRTDASVSLRGVRPGAVVCLLTSDLEIAVLSLEKLPSVGSPVLRFGYRLWH
ncbi:MAG: hypothetical protein JWP61_1461, partial [Friedmanniella sp.]|nr:hypothetical protein [Friedmanniella sp.]